MYEILSAIDSLSTTCHKAMPATKVRVTSATNPVDSKLKSIQVRERERGREREREGGGERERERQTDRQTDRQREREREAEKR